MADPELAVELDGKIIGSLRRAGRDTTLLYNDDYRAEPSRTTLSMAMPRTARRHLGSTPEAWLWGLLPDNDEVLRRWAREFNASQNSAASYLASEIGLDCAGAVRFFSPDHSPRHRDSGVTWLTDDEMDLRIGELISDSSTWHLAGATGQFSLAGAQTKTALRFDAETNRWGIPYGDQPSTHIIKPAVPGFPQQEVNEHLCLSAARHLGLVAAQTEIREFGGHQVLVVERFDRVQLQSGEWSRVHQEDMCQALGVSPSRKYQADGGPSISDIAALLRRTSEPAIAEREINRFVDALIFNWVIAGTDAHAKNFGLLHSGPQTRLAPLYDVSSYLPYDDSKGHKLKMAMKIGGEYKIKRIGRTQWERLATDVGTNADVVVNRCEELLVLLQDAFEAAAEDLGPGPAVAEQILDGLASARRARLDSLAGGFQPMPEPASFALALVGDLPHIDRFDKDAYAVRMQLLVRPVYENEHFYYQFIVVRWQKAVLDEHPDRHSTHFWNRVGAAAVHVAQSWLSGPQRELTPNAIDGAILVADDVPLEPWSTDSRYQFEDRMVIAEWTDSARFIRRPDDQMRGVGNLFG